MGRRPGSWGQGDKNIVCHTEFGVLGKLACILQGMICTGVSVGTGRWVTESRRCQRLRSSPWISGSFQGLRDLVWTALDPPLQAPEPGHVK